MSYDLTTNYTTGQPLPAAEVNRLHKIANTQLSAALKYFGAGVLSRVYGSSSFAVTAGTGLQVFIAPGAGFILGTSPQASAYIERTTQLALAVPASSTFYIWQGLENTGSNKTEETGLPLTFTSANASEPNAILLASGTTDGTTVTNVTDRRTFADRASPVPPMELTADWTVTASNHNLSRLIMRSASARTITLPTGDAGYGYRFVITNAGTNTLQVMGTFLDPVTGTEITNPMVPKFETLEALGVYLTDSGTEPPPSGFLKDGAAYAGTGRYIYAMT